MGNSKYLDRKNTLYDYLKKKKEIEWDSPTFDAFKQAWDNCDSDTTNDGDEDWTLDNDPAATACTQEMAERVMDALCEDGRGDLLMIKDDEIREWWAGILRRRKKIADREAELERVRMLREGALKKLSAEERRVLGIEGDTNDD